MRANDFAIVQFSEKYIGGKVVGNRCCHHDGRLTVFVTIARMGFHFYKLPLKPAKWKEYFEQVPLFLTISWVLLSSGYKLVQS